MVKWPILTDEDIAEFKKLLGTESEPYEVEVTKDVIRHLAQAVGDTNPLWQDVEEAGKSSYGGIIALPALYVCNLMNTYAQGKFSLPHKGRHLDGFQEWELRAPIRPGDIITVQSKMTDVYERQGKQLERMVFCVLETTLTNQRGEIVGVNRGSSARY